MELVCQALSWVWHRKSHPGDTEGWFVPVSENSKCRANVSGAFAGPSEWLPRQACRGGSSIVLQGPGLYLESNCRMEIVWEAPLGPRYFGSCSPCGPGISLEVRLWGDFELQSFRAKLDLTDGRPLSYKLGHGGSEELSACAKVTVG